ncbi:hypothetical protein HRbin34_00189 [bacterium HR34]|nr:hypothetical protein HRbin34_00189 [bacterium HR34]
MEEIFNAIKNLTTYIYKVTDNLPQDPLKHKIREKTLDLLNKFYSSEITSSEKEFLINELKIFFAYLDISEHQNLIEKRHIITIKESYIKILKLLLANNQQKAKQKPQQKTTKAKNSIKIHNTNNNERKTKILSIIKDKKIISISSLYDLFPDITTRTLRRDMADLVQKGFIEPIGKGIYRLKDFSQKDRISHIIST